MAVTMEKRDAIDMRHICEYSLFLSLPAGRFYSDKVNSLKFKWFHGDLKLWEVPITSLLDVLKLFTEMEVVGEIPELEILKQKRNMKKKEFYENLECIEEYPIDMPIKNGTQLKPFGHQIEGLHYMMNRNVLLLADDMGLGKTLQFASACEWRHKRNPNGFKKVLYVTKAGLRQNVEEDLKFWLPNRQIIVLDGNEKQRMDKLRLFYTTKELTYCLISYEGVKKHIEHLKLIPIDAVAVDECHKMKNAKGPIYEAMSQIKWIPFRVPMSGTPVINRPEELWPIMDFLGIEERPYYVFVRRHYAWGGFQNKIQQGVNFEEMEKTHFKLRDHMLRRMKKEVMDMPEKFHQDIYVTMSSKQAILYQSVKDQIKEEISQLEKARTFGNPLVKILRLKQVLTNPEIIESDAPSAKHERLLDLVEELSEAGHKIIVFTQFETVEIDSLTKLLRKYNPAIITGKVDDWQPQVRKFWDDPTCSVFLGTSAKCREGLNLQCATYVIFLDLEWAPAYISQCEDRAMRIGQKNNLTIIRLLCRDTVDSYIVNTVLKKKQAIFDAIVEGKGGMDSSDIQDLLANL